MIGIVDGDGILYRAIANVEDLNEAFDKYQSILKGYLAAGWCDSHINFVGGQGNWRKDLFYGYKATRKTRTHTDPVKQAKYTLEDAIRKELLATLIKERLAIPSHGCEADDLVRRKAVKCMARGQQYVVISADKDLDCIQGDHIRPSQFGELKEYEVTKEDGEYNYLLQLMIGDMTDNIKSPHLLGPATAKKILDGNPRHLWRSLIEQEYKDRCGKEWEHALLFTGSLIHIQRHQGDMFKWNKVTFADRGYKDAPSCYTYTLKQLGG